MSKEKERISSDESDEDFCPEEENDVLSEEESDDDISDNEQSIVQKEKKKQSRSKKHNRSKRKQITEQSDEDNTSKKKDASVSSFRKTRHSDVTENGKTKSSLEKDELDSDEEDKSRTDALWADFLSDVKPNTSTTTKNKSNKKIPTGSPSKNSTSKSKDDDKQTSPKEKKIVTTEIFDFAGEEVKTEKTVSSDSIKENKQISKASGSGLGLKRPAATAAGGSGGIGNLLNQLGKKKKISVLEKTKLDWNNFKVTEGIQEDLQTFNKGKDGYLERQDFLQRTDLRQFEIEKNLRQSKRNNR